MIFDLGDGREGDLHDLTIGTFDLYAGSSEGLGSLHASHGSAHSPAVRCNDLDVVLAVKRLQRRECFGYFHRRILPTQICLLVGRKSIVQPDATGNHDLAYRTCPCILRLNANNRWDSNVAGHRNHLLKLPFEDAVGPSLLSELRISTTAKHGGVWCRTVFRE